MKTKLADEVMEVAAMMASAVGKSAYLHLNRAASIAMAESKLVIAKFDFIMMFILMLATSIPRVCISNL